MGLKPQRLYGRQYCGRGASPLPRAAPCGESSAAGGFPAVGDGRSRREPVLDEGLPTEGPDETSAAGGSPSVGDWRTRRALGFPQSLSGEATQATSFDRCGDCGGFPRHVFGGSFPPKAAAPL
ncbi:MAG: hypothetical protein KME49_18920 [Brasilonema octagenarum HA4186-MV1]|nr:hypothetical protein [Brasilonema octagenarum HA4186-MV1]